jgi:hypothetical protein
MDLKANLNSVLNHTCTLEKKDQILYIEMQTVTIYSKLNVVKHGVRYGFTHTHIYIYIYKECTLSLQPKPTLFADDIIIMYHPKSARFKNCIDSTVAE